MNQKRYSRKPSGQQVAPRSCAQAVQAMMWRSFSKRLHDQIHVSGASGNATGRNIHQKSLEEAVRMCNAIYDITVNGKSVEEAMKTYNSK